MANPMESTMARDGRVDELLEHLAESRRVLADAIALVPPALRQTAPAPGQWSVAQVIEHLVIVETRSTKVIAMLSDGAPVGSATDTDAPAPDAHRLDTTMLLDRSRRVTAPDPLHPTSDVDAADAWRRLGETRAALCAIVVAMNGRRMDRVTRPHPVLGVLNGFQWVGAVAGHEQRHAAQIREIAGALGAG
jgi:hypothetical protein